MNLLKTYSLKRKLVVLIVIGFTVSIITASIYAAISFKKAAINSSYETALLIADNYAQRIKLNMERGMQLSILFNGLFMTNDRTTFSKEKTVTFLSDILTENKNIHNIYQIWEFDPFGKTESDSLYHKNSFQQFIPYLSKIGDEIIYENVGSDFIKKNEAIYNSVKRNRLQTVSDVFFIKANGRNVLAVTVVTPIMSSNRFYGITSYNLLLGNIRTIINEPVYYNDNTNLMLISDKDKIVFVSGKDRLSTKDINEYRGLENELYKRVKPEKRNKFKDIVATYSSFKIGETRKEWEIFAFVPQNMIITSFIDSIYISILVASLLMIIGLLIIVYLVNKSFSPVNKVLNTIEKLSYGELSKIEKTNNKDEIGKINNFLHKIISNLSDAVKINQQIASGDFSQNIILQSKKDILGSSINMVSKNLKKLEQETIKNKEKSDIQIWQRKGRFEVANAQIKSSYDINELAFNLLKTVVNYSGAVLGGVYLNRNTEEEPYVELIVAYAYGNKKYMTKKFKHGNGLPGTAAIEKKKIVMNKIPQDYLTIVSGLGNSQPQFLIILPIFNNNELIALLEIAFIKQIENYKMQFIEQLSTNIGFWLGSALIHVEINKILEKTQNQKKELSEKEAKLNNKISELQQIQNKYARNSSEMQNMLNAVNQTLMTSEYTPEGILITANELFLKTLEFDIKKVKGVNIFKIIKEQDNDVQEIFERVKRGEHINNMNVTRYTTTGKKKLLSASYTPYYDTDKKISKIVFFAFDITDIVK